MNEIEAVGASVSVSPESLSGLIEAEKATYRFFQRLGLPYKRVRRYEFADVPGCTTWCNGVITFRRGIGSGFVVAHELGHGAHEALNARGASMPQAIRYPHGGEAFAEAVRYFVEVQEGTGSDWVKWAHRGEGNCKFLSEIGYHEGVFGGMIT